MLCAFINRMMSLVIFMVLGLQFRKFFQRLQSSLKDQLSALKPIENHLEFALEKQRILDIVM
jgi:hypothetical protein